MSLNANYMNLFKNSRDASHFANLARQIYPNRSQFAIEAYKDVTRELLVNLYAEQDDDLHLRTNVYPGDSLRVRRQMSKSVK